MRKLSVTVSVAAGALVVAGALVFLGNGCGGGDDAPKPAAGGTAAPAAAKATPKASSGPVFTPDPATAGTIAGKVALNADPPRMAQIQMASDPACERQHDDPVHEETVVRNADGTLRNVLVYVKTNSPAIAGKKFAPPSTPLTLDQKGCTYHPHVFSATIGQTLTVLNSDPVSHNIHSQPDPKKNESFNFSQPRVGMKNPVDTSDYYEEIIRIKCDVHGWMNSYFGVFPHPYHAVTGEEGAYALSNLPPGEYDVVAWHEHYGEKTQKVTLDAKESKTVEFAFP